MNNELKIKCVENTIKTLTEMAEESEKNSADWYKVGLNDLANWYEGKGKAYRFAIELLKKDLEE